jgi:2-iminobutanoate/2-iminopropanoate deaminase
MAKREIIPVGTAHGVPVSRGIKFGNMIYTSGLSPRDVKTGIMPTGSMHDICRATLNNVKTVVEAGGGKLKDVISITCYLPDINRDFKAWNDVYVEFFSDPFPTRTTVQTPLYNDIRMEVMAIACIPDE